jgi:ABC-type spermidine/putrescine transport system permease subunit I
MIGRVLWDEFFSNNDWPMASSVAVVLVVLIVDAPWPSSTSTRPKPQERR